jgi:hypothetical protein
VCKFYEQGVGVVGEGFFLILLKTKDWKEKYGTLEMLLAPSFQRLNFSPGLSFSQGDPNRA